MKAITYPILLLIVSIFFFGCFSNSPQKPEVVASVNKLLQEQKVVFTQLIDSFQKIKSHSKDWELQYFLKRGVLFYSHQPFETYGISFAAYRQRYYGTIDTNASPSYVEDFIIPANFKNEIEKVHVNKVRIVKDSSGSTNRVNFYFKSEKFPPIMRTVILSYFPGNIPDTLKTAAEYVDELNWQHIVDNQYLLRSMGME